jgi:dTDP-4-dehydrorhamnose 3,5-epimerase
MIVEPTDISGCHVIRPSRHVDERGHFARTWDPEILGAHGIDTALAQCSVSYNRLSGTLRGMHFQRAPHEEQKMVRCTRGALFDVCLDLRPDSPTWGAWVGETLTADNGLALVIPVGCAHGFMTLTDETEIFYMISAPYAPESAGGVRYDDPAFGIEWPGAALVINERDATYPYIEPDQSR